MHTYRSVPARSLPFKTICSSGPSIQRIFAYAAAGDQVEALFGKLINARPSAISFVFRHHRGENLVVETSIFRELKATW